MNVNVEEIYKIKRRLAEINLEQLEDITFYANGCSVQVTQEMIDEWKYLGLNNTDFIMTEFYKTPLPGKEVE